MTISLVLYLFSMFLCLGMIRVRAAARLHFGLFNLFAAEDAGSSEPGEVPSTRQYGGAGLMIREPGVTVAVHPATEWSAEGPLAQRALDYARLVAQALPPDALTPQRIVVEAAPEEHIGLGTGTQLGLALARALTTAAQREHVTAIDLARLTGRGSRSALGVHGFEHGGFLIEGGKRQPLDISPLVAWAAFPLAWRILLVHPPCGSGLHGAVEKEAFGSLRRSPEPSRLIDVLCRLALLGMLPALAEEDIAAFGDALYEFNRKAGEAFASVQQGYYAHPRIAELVAFLRGQGLHGVGQSSWGPTVFAVAPAEEAACNIGLQLQSRFGLKPDEVRVVTASNQGAQII
jgi:beta-ribofuranosylaminobenzene 5'-phosphate synthase